MTRIRQFMPRVRPRAAKFVEDVLASGYIGEGSQVRTFEAVLADRLRHPYVLATSSGTAALKLAYEIIGIKAGDVVATTPLTCLATNLPLLRLGAVLRWVDVDPSDGGMDPSALVFALKEGNVKAVVVCDWGGDVGHLTAIQALCAQYGVPLVEDAAHAFGATHEGHPVGSGLSTFTAFSFQAIKLLTTGDGGCLVTQHAHDRETGRLLRWFGLDRNKGESMRCYQQIPVAGDKYQMNDIAAAIGLANMDGLDEALDRQRTNAAYYDVAFGPAPMDGLRGRRVLPDDCVQPIRPLARHAGSACWLYSVRVPNARQFIAAMEKRGVECSQVHARNDVQGLFSRFWRVLPGMDVLDRELVALPCGWWLVDDDLKLVAHHALEVFRTGECAL